VKREARRAGVWLGLLCACFAFLALLAFA